MRTFIVLSSETTVTILCIFVLITLLQHKVHLNADFLQFSVAIVKPLPARPPAGEYH
jgi:hypothetical protein